MQTIYYPRGFDQWRSVARDLLEAEVIPQQIIWQDYTQAGLFGEDEIPPPKTNAPYRIPKDFLSLARTVSCHRSGDQWAHLYSLLWRLTHGERHLLAVATDRDVHPLAAMTKEIRRDIHKMHAFVRFRKVGDSAESKREQFVAWFEPEHLIVPLTANFFRKRFAGMDWSILTPDNCIHWDGENIHFTEGVDQSQAPDADAQDELWRTYYRSIFNPARLKVKAMLSEMPKKYWKNLPEAEIIDELVAESRASMESMLEASPSPEKPAPKNAYLDRLRRLDENS